MPNYLWRRESVKTQGKEANSSLVLSASSALLLGSVSRTDGGLYVCEAHNKHGTVRAQVYLDVLCTYVYCSLFINKTKRLLRKTYFAYLNRTPDLRKLRPKTPQPGNKIFIKYITPQFPRLSKLLLIHFLP